MLIDDTHTPLADAMACALQSGIQIDAEFVGLILSAYRNESVRIFRSKNSKPIAFVSWAMIDETVMRRVAKGRKAPRYLYEWSSGEIMFILSFGITEFDPICARKQLRKFILSYKTISYVRKGYLFRIENFPNSKRSISKMAI